jgi:hypothetical protein
MERILIFIKHHFDFLWEVIEWGNGLLFSLFYKARLKNPLLEVFKEFTLPPFSFRRLEASDTELLYGLIKSQKASDLEYFRPHEFDLSSIKKQFLNHSFLMMGAFEQDRLAGYFFLRFFFNKKCFVGRLIDKPYRGHGVGLVMNNIMYETAWRMGFRCLSTISRNNTSVMQAHSKNPNIIVLKELQNGYLLVEFVREPMGPVNSDRRRVRSK